MNIVVSVTYLKINYSEKFLLDFLLLVWVGNLKGNIFISVGRDQDIVVE